MSDIRNNEQLLDLARDEALEVSTLRRRLTEAYRVLAKDAAENMKLLEEGSRPWSIGHQRSVEHLQLESVLEARTSSLSKLLYVLGRKDELEALTADPFLYEWAA